MQEPVYLGFGDQSTSPPIIVKSATIDSLETEKSCLCLKKTVPVSVAWILMDNGILKQNELDNRNDDRTTLFDMRQWTAESPQESLSGISAAQLIRLRHPGKKVTKLFRVATEAERADWLQYFIRARNPRPTSSGMSAFAVKVNMQPTLNEKVLNYVDSIIRVAVLNETHIG